MVNNDNTLNFLTLLPVGVDVGECDRCPEESGELRSLDDLPDSLLPDDDDLTNLLLLVLRVVFSSRVT